MGSWQFRFYCFIRRRWWSVRGSIKAGASVGRTWKPIYFGYFGFQGSLRCVLLNQSVTNEITISTTDSFYSSDCCSLFLNRSSQHWSLYFHKVFRFLWVLFKFDWSELAGRFFFFFYVRIPLANRSHQHSS